MALTLIAAQYRLASAQEADLPLVVTFDSTELSSELAKLNKYADEGRVPLPLIYIQGRLAGSIPGEFKLPKSDEPIAIEIGIPQLTRTPIYSFAIYPTSIKTQTIELVNSNFEFRQQGGPTVWDDVFLDANTAKSIFAHADTTSLKLEIPAEPYVSLAKFWASSDIRTYDKDWIAKIPDQNDLSLKGNIDHVVFNAATLQPAPLSESHAWSVSNRLLPFPTSTQIWEIKSSPENATVYTDEGNQGRTNIRKELKITSAFFVVVKLPGFPDCTDQTGQKAELNGVVTLTCNFR